MKKPLHFKNKEDEESFHFSTYVLLKPGICFGLVDKGLDYEEIDSALYPLYLEEKKKVYYTLLSQEKVIKEFYFKIMSLQKKKVN